MSFFTEEAGEGHGGLPDVGAGVMEMLSPSPPKPPPPDSRESRWSVQGVPVMDEAPPTVIELVQSHPLPLTMEQKAVRPQISKGFDNYTETWRHVKLHQKVKEEWKSHDAISTFQERVRESQGEAMQYALLNRQLDHSRATAYEKAKHYFQDKNGGMQMVKKNLASKAKMTASGTLLATVSTHFDQETYNAEIKEALLFGRIGTGKMDSNMIKMKPEDTEAWKRIEEGARGVDMIIDDHLVSRQSKLFPRDELEWRSKFHLLTNNRMAHETIYWQLVSFRMSRHGPIHVWGKAGMTLLCDASEALSLRKVKGVFVPHVLELYFEGEEGFGASRRKVCIAFDGFQVRDQVAEHIQMLMSKNTERTSALTSMHPSIAADETPDEEGEQEMGAWGWWTSVASARKPSAGAKGGLGPARKTEFA